MISTSINVDNFLIFQSNIRIDFSRIKFIRSRIIPKLLIIIRTPAIDGAFRIKCTGMLCPAFYSFHGFTVQISIHIHFNGNFTANYLSISQLTSTVITPAVDLIFCI